MGGAGHETTANTLAWALYLLATHPEAQAELVEELNSVEFTSAASTTTSTDSNDDGGDNDGGDDDHVQVASFEDARTKLPLTLAVIYETLRLYPTVPVFPRECAKAGVKLGGFDVPKGSLVIVVSNPVHRDEKFFHEPNNFLPKRFLGVPSPSTSLPVGAPGKGPKGKFAFMPFGAGQRTCVGQRFAILEAVLLLSAIAKRFHLSMPDDHDGGDGGAAARAAVKEHLAITLRPIGLKLVLRHRDPPKSTGGDAGN